MSGPRAPHSLRHEPQSPRLSSKSPFCHLARRVSADRGVFVVNNSFRRPSGESSAGRCGHCSAPGREPNPNQVLDRFHMQAWMRPTTI